MNWFFLCCSLFLPGVGQSCDLLNFCIAPLSSSGEMRPALYPPFTKQMTRFKMQLSAMNKATHITVQSTATTTFLAMPVCSFRNASISWSAGRSVCWSVNHFSPDTHGPQKMTPNDLPSSTTMTKTLMLPSRWIVKTVTPFSSSTIIR